MNSLNKRLISLVSIVGPLVTLAVSPWLNYDPINLPKILVLTTISFGSFGLLLGSRKHLSLIPWQYWFPLLFFPVSLFIPFFLADSPKSQQFWGIFGRNTGLLTYLSLAFILIASIYTGFFGGHKKIVLSLISTIIIVTVYCLFQAANLDPITWSQNKIFGTLGNMNFLSAFLGIGMVSIFALILGERLVLWRKVALSLTVLIDFLLIIETDSIQGIAIAIFGMGIVVYARIRSLPIWKKIRLPVGSLILVGIYLSSLGLIKRGPLGSFLYQDSTVFRADYMRAALKMLQLFPWTGVGLDSYDAWYRRVRGFISAYRTGPNRTSNSAHNIVLDIASGGGVIVLLAYLMIFLVALIAGIRMMRRSARPSTWQIAIFSTWCAYQLQSLVSINQISVGVWGWIFSGLLIGNGIKARGQSIDATKNIEDTFPGKSRKNLRKDVARPIPAQSAVLGLVFALLGFYLSYLPLGADIQYRKAMESKDLSAIMKMTTNPAASAFHVAKALEIVNQNQLWSDAALLSERLTERYPGEPFGWQIRAGLSTLSMEDQKTALTKVQESDPWFACADVDPYATILSWYRQLSAEQRWEMLQWWEIARGPMVDRSQLLRLEQGEAFERHVKSYCGL